MKFAKILVRMKRVRLIKILYAEHDMGCIMCMMNEDGDGF